MKKLAGKFLWVIVLCSLVDQVAAARKVGLDAMADFDGLPVLEEGAGLYQISSHDRSGANNDGFDGSYSALYRDDEGDYVLFDEIGSGCISRIWMTFSTANLNPTNHIRFYFDDEIDPGIDVSLADFFGGTVAPFLSPLVGTPAVSSGGYYCYLPFPFARRCRIEMSHKPYFYNINYQRFASTNEVESWTGLEDSSVVRDMWSHCGIDPKPTNGNVHTTGTLSIPSGSTGMVFSAFGEGAIAGLLLDPEPHSSEILGEVWINMYWDEAIFPQVSAPLGEFFGCGFSETNVSALPIGMGSGSPYYCWFPMPFWQSARIELVNHSISDLTNIAYEVHYHDRAYDQARAGLFYATAQAKEITENDGQDYLLLNTNGWGKVVGAVLSILNKSVDPLGYLEGDERIYIDGSSSPQLYGTGTEDFFNGGWYFNQGTFSLPVHGNPMRKHEWRSDWNDPPYITNNFTAAYRFFLSDSIPFLSSIRFGIEHGYNNSQLGSYSSVVYYYKIPSRAGMVLRAELDVGDPLSEAASDYEAPGSLLATNTWRYEGDADGVAITDTGRICTNASSFSVSIGSTNMGLVIRRRADAVPGQQRVQVYVDDSLAGDWYMPDCNFTNMNKRWVDAEFWVAAEYTAGKTSVTIRLERDHSGADQWNAYRYWVYALVPLLPTGDLDVDGLPDEWEVVYFDNIKVAGPDVDSDGDTMVNRSEYIAGTDPVDSGSLFHLEIDSEKLSFHAQADRSYTLWHSTNLLTGAWSVAQTNVQGSGEVLSWPLPEVETNGFYRADVRLQ